MREELKWIKISMGADMSDTRKNQRTLEKQNNSRVKGISRRELLGAFAVGGAASLAAPAVVRADEKIVWKMAMSWPRNVPGVGVNAQRLAEMITTMSGGRLTIELFAAGELVPPFEVFDAVSNNVAQMGHATPYYWQGKNQAFHFFTGVPFGLTAAEHSGWLYFGGGQELWQRAYEPFGVLPFYAGSSGPQAGGWFRKEINSLADLQGIKMRIAGLGGEAMRRLGVNVVLLPPGEIFPAMQAGTVDAAEWVGPWNDLAFGLYKVAKYYYMPAFHEIGPALEAIVNKEAYAALPEDLQELVKRAVMASATESYADFTYGNVKSFAPLLAKEGVELRTFPNEVMQALYKASEETLLEISQTSALAEEIYKSFMTYRQEADGYARHADLAALNMRAMVMGEG
ncbi:TRAP transporter substrate-binding protein [Kiloniella laminariae]|uniref:TRAP transporter substrate-binding protein n=1 Tax=Kiloniella laminariae TaxID=454162 RepID=A0ABT4LPM1_9PROT|nr:TRAP transporter substrate-binding protein [Kiloniella laminariae]MCZ4282256.1 TRAP transporter substrate-binding protein [Kiloniella laminariae]